MSAPREPDRKRTVTDLAAEFHAPVDAVAALYEREWADLVRGARITTFLDIFVVRKVQDALRRRDRDESTAPAAPATLSEG